MSNASDCSIRAPTSSATVNWGSSPASKAFARRMRVQKRWMVEIQAVSIARARSHLARELEALPHPPASAPTRPGR